MRNEKKIDNLCLTFFFLSKTKIKHVRVKDEYNFVKNSKNNEKTKNIF